MPLFILIKSRQRKKKDVDELNSQPQPSSPLLLPQTDNNQTSATTENLKEMEKYGLEPVRFSKMLSGAAAKLSKRAKSFPTFWKKSKEEVVTVTVATTPAIATAIVSTAAEENRDLAVEKEKKEKDKEPLTTTSMKLVLLSTPPSPPSPPSPAKAKPNSLQVDVELSLHKKAADFPQRCRYDPHTDEYVPVHLWKPRQQDGQPVFEISELMSPIREELRGLVENSTVRTDEEKAKFEVKRLSLHQDMEIQFLEVDSQTRAIVEELCGDHDEDEDATSMYSSLEDDTKPLPHRDSGISMGGSSPVEDRPRDGAKEYWSSVRDSIRLLEEEENIQQFDTDSTTDLDSTDRFSPFRMRAKTWSPRARWEYSLGNRISDAPDDWRHVLWVSPSLKEQLVRRQSLYDVTESTDS